jgi:hypothetical protein
MTAARADVVASLSPLCGSATTPTPKETPLKHWYGGGRSDWFVWEYWTQALPGVDAPDIQREQLKIYAEKIMPTFR